MRHKRAGDLRTGSPIKHFDATVKLDGAYPFERDGTPWMKLTYFYDGITRWVMVPIDEEIEVP